MRDHLSVDDALPTVEHGFDERERSPRLELTRHGPELRACWGWMPLSLDPCQRARLLSRLRQAFDDAHAGATRRRIECDARGALWLVQPLPSGTVDPLRIAGDVRRYARVLERLRLCRGTLLPRMLSEIAPGAAMPSVDSIDTPAEAGAEDTAPARCAA